MKPLAKRPGIALLTTFIVALLFMSFTCTRPCKASFSTRGGLSRHRNQCAVFRTSQALKFEQRRILAIRGKDEVRKGRMVRRPVINSETVCHTFTVALFEG
jgi:hypothetical protein